MPKIIDLTHQRFEKLTVLERDRKDPRNKTQKTSFWRCKCECGKLTTVSYNNLVRGQTKSCGCLLSKPHEKEVEDLSNKVFGNITVLERDYTYRKEHNIKQYSTYWKCQCSCGNIFSTTKHRLLSKQIQSCGCLASKGEQKITLILSDKKIKFKTQYCFPGFLLTSGGMPRFDYAIFNSQDKLIFLIEYHGIQHYQYKNSFWDTEENFRQRIQRDKEKEEYCQSNCIPLEIISYKHYADLEKILDELLKKYLIKEN